MARIIPFPVPGHRWYVCDGKHEDGGSACWSCNGLSMCVLCGGAEGAIPTDCPGEWMHDIVEQEVFDGELDFRRVLGGWVRMSNRGTPPKRERPQQSGWYEDWPPDFAG